VKQDFQQNTHLALLHCIVFSFKLWMFESVLEPIISLEPVQTTSPIHLASMLGLVSCNLRCYCAIFVVKFQTLKSSFQENEQLLQIISLEPGRWKKMQYTYLGIILVAHPQIHFGKKLFLWLTDV
jgi:hypothetical protein